MTGNAYGTTQLDFGWVETRFFLFFCFLLVLFLGFYMEVLGDKTLIQNSCSLEKFVFNQVTFPWGITWYSPLAPH